MDQVEFEAKAKAAFDLVEDKARQIGLYADEAVVMMMPDGNPVLVVNFMIGDVAFSERVQDPQKHATNSMVDTMKQGILGSSWLDERDRLQKALRAGINPLDAISTPREDLGN